MTVINTIGTVRVACSNGATVGVPLPATRTSGASAANSAACLRMSSAVAQRVSIRRLPPSLQPNCFRACMKAARRACPSASSAARYMSTPMRRTRSGCCARAAIGQATAAPPINFDELAPAHVAPEARDKAPYRLKLAHWSNVRFGSKADICAAKSHVRFTPDSGHSLARLACRLRPSA